MECQSSTEVQLSILFVRLADDLLVLSFLALVNDGEYLSAVSEQSLAENVTRVLYPNDNVRNDLCYLSPSSHRRSFVVHARQRTSSETRILSGRCHSLGYHPPVQTLEIRRCLHHARRLQHFPG